MLGKRLALVSPKSGFGRLDLERFTTPHRLFVDRNKTQLAIHFHLESVYIVNQLHDLHVLRGEIKFMTFMVS